MPKNPHPPRQGGPSKKPGSKAEGDANTSATKKDGSTKKGIVVGGDAVPSGSPSSKTKPNAAKADEVAGETSEAKKPDVRTLIGGASWTGKLPMNMLSEHCQKQKWTKPEYTMVLS